MTEKFRIATIGCEPTLVKLARAACQRSHVELVANYELASPNSPLSQELRELNNGPSHRPEAWESMLDGSTAELVLLGQLPVDNDRQVSREEVLRRLVQASIPMVVIHPPCEMLLAYELQMIRDDSHALVFPYVPWLHHPAVQRVVEAMHDDTHQDTSNDISQIVFERYVDTNSYARDDVLPHVARDAFLLMRMMREVKSVSATAAAAGRRPLASLAVNLMGEDSSELVSRWSINPKREGTHLDARISLIGHDGTGFIELDDDQQTARSQLPTESTSQSQSVDLADDFIDQVLSAVREDQPWRGPTWEEGCRSLEITDAVERSLKRRRTIELYHERVTEHDTFKSMMAAGGCGMMLWVMLLLFVAGLVEGLQLPIRDMLIWKLWPALLVAPLAIFLALQLLQLVFKKREA